MKKLLSRLSMIMLLGIFICGCGEKKTDYDKNIDKNEEIEEISGRESDANDKPKERVVATELPESVKNREIFIKGVKRGESRVLGTEAFLADCNLNVASTDEEFVEFVNEFAGNDSVTFNNNTSAYIKYWDEEKQNYTSTHYQIFRTSEYTGDISTGMVYVEDDPGYDVLYFFDPTGKYILSCMFGEPEDVVMRFVEPKVNGVNVSVSVDGDEKEKSFSDKEDINKFLDAFHALNVEPIGNQNKDLTECSKKVTFSYELADGRVLTYDFYDDDYLLRDGVIYRVNDNEKLVQAVGDNIQR